MSVFEDVRGEAPALSPLPLEVITLLGTLHRICFGHAWYEQVAALIAFALHLYRLIIWHDVIWAATVKLWIFSSILTIGNIILVYGWLKWPLTLKHFVICTALVAVGQIGGYCLTGIFVLNEEIEYGFDPIIDFPILCLSTYMTYACISVNQKQPKHGIWASMWAGDVCYHLYEICLLLLHGNFGYARFLTANSF
eukprot:328071_1